MQINREFVGKALPAWVVGRALWRGQWPVYSSKTWLSQGSQGRTIEHSMLLMGVTNRAILRTVLPVWVHYPIVTIVLLINSDNCPFDWYMNHPFPPNPLSSFFPTFSNLVHRSISEVETQSTCNRWAQDSVTCVDRFNLHPKMFEYLQVSCCLTPEYKCNHNNFIQICSFPFITNKPWYFSLARCASLSKFHFEHFV